MMVDDVSKLMTSSALIDHVIYLGRVVYLAGSDGDAEYIGFLDTMVVYRLFLRRNYALFRGWFGKENFLNSLKICLFMV